MKERQARIFYGRNELSAPAHNVIFAQGKRSRSPGQRLMSGGFDEITDMSSTAPWTRTILLSALA